MRLNANLLRIAHMFLRDADDAVSVFPCNEVIGVRLVASDGVVMLVLWDDFQNQGQIECPTYSPMRVRIDKATLARMKDPSANVLLEYDKYEIEMPGGTLSGPCYMDHQPVQWSHVLHEVLREQEQGADVHIASKYWSLLAKTAEELAVHNGFKKADGGITATSSRPEDPLLVRFTHAAAVALVGARAPGGAVPTREEISKWAL